MRKLKSIMVCAATFAAIPAGHASAAETQSLTIFAKSDPRYVDGKLSMCSIYFSTIFADPSLGDRVFFAEGTFGNILTEGGRRFGPFTKVAVGERIWALAPRGELRQVQGEQTALQGGDGNE